MPPPSRWGWVRLCDRGAVGPARREPSPRHAPPHKATPACCTRSTCPQPAQETPTTPPRAREGGGRPARLAAGTAQPLAGGSQPARTPPFHGPAGLGLPPCQGRGPAAWLVYTTATLPLPLPPPCRTPAWPHAGAVGLPWPASRLHRGRPAGSRAPHRHPMARGCYVSLGAAPQGCSGTPKIFLPIRRADRPKCLAAAGPPALPPMHPTTCRQALESCPARRGGLPALQR